MYFDHTHPPLPSLSFILPPNKSFPLPYPSFSFYDPLSLDMAACMSMIEEFFGFDFLYFSNWGMSNLPVATSLKKNDFPDFQQPLTANGPSVSGETS